jgi:hypothetical protein
MKLTLSWMNTAGRMDPCCSSLAVNKDGVSLLSCLLMDDGGISYLHTLHWIDEGIARMDAVMNGNASIQEWDRETWGAKIRPDEVRIHSLHDEDYSESIGAATFRRALVAWRDFLQSPADVSMTRDVEV